MPQFPAIPLVVSNDIEKLKSWEGISTPHDLALYIARVLSVDPSKILSLNEIVYSDVQPTGLNAKKIWIKTDVPVAVGIPTGDGYKMMYEYPPNTPILWTQGIENIPQYMRELSSGEYEDYSITEPSNDSITWVIYSI